MTAKEWLQEADAAVEPFTLAVHGRNARSRAINRFHVMQAAQLIWVRTGGAPCWTKVDVAALMERCAAGRGRSAGKQSTALLTFLSFYTWLFRSGRLTREESLPVLRAFYASEQSGAAAPWLN